MTVHDLTDEERLDWLRLARTPGVGPATVVELVSRFGTATSALEALPDLARRGGRRGNLAIPSRGDAEREHDKVARLDAAMLVFCEPRYPAILRHIAAPPPVLYLSGNAAIFSQPAVAIVGARNASAAGLAMARVLARELGTAGVTVVSGLARGVDTAAHTASIDTGTVAVIAGGLDVIYPPENAALMRRIAEVGAVVTEMPPGTRPVASHFPRRNRLISGLSSGVVVVEAAERSGSLITARYAAEQGREVFAVPGSPLDPRSAGVNRLIRSGATLTTGARDVLTVLDPMIREIPPAAPPQVADLGTPDTGSVADDARGRILELLGPTPVDCDDLIVLSGLSPGVVHTILLELDLAGRLERHGSGAVAMLQTEAPRASEQPI